jgi:sugar lactone lactonase YvrE
MGCKGKSEEMKLRFTLTFIAVISAWLSLSVTAGAHPASGIVLDRAGNIYFSDLETIWKIDTGGKLSVFRAGVSGRHVHELAIDEQDNIYGADFSYESQKFISDIWKMTPDGKFEYLLEPTDHPPTAMSIWRDRAGNNYWIDQNNHTKTQTLLLRRSPDGKVTTLAGSAYGHADGKGTAAKFSSVGGVAFGPDGSFYLADGASVRKVAMDGTVITLANGLDARTKEDKPLALVGSYGNLAGLAIDSANNVYVADAGNRRLLRVNREGKVDVLLRTDPPFFPNGVVAGPGGYIYVLEVGFTLPSTSSGPRIRKLSADGKSTILATVGVEGNGTSSKTAGTSIVRPDPPASILTYFGISEGIGERTKYLVVILSAGILCTGVVLWQRRRRQRV